MDDSTKHHLALSLEEAQALLSSPMTRLSVDAPCTTDRGIEVWTEEELERRCDRYAESPPVCGLWVPASGAASRMFRPVEDDVDVVVDMWAQRHSYGLGGMWEQQVKETAESSEDPETLRRALMRCMHGGSLPKGLVPFHRTGEYHDAETALEAHVRFWHHDMGGGDVWFTVPPTWRATMEEHLAAHPSVAASAIRIHTQIQDPGTDTPVLMDNGQWIRREDGSVLRRPGGHGALISNLEALSVPMVVIRNIDNAPSPAQSSLRRRWTRAMVQAMEEWRMEREDLVHAVTRQSTSWRERAESWLSDQFKDAGVLQDMSQADVMDWLSRPMRLVAVVRNEGQPGGGPCWVQAHNDAAGMIRRQIVEAIEFEDDQQLILERATHFNPVDMVCVPGTQPLVTFMDRSRFMVARKQVQGIDARVLEYPGLWNGSMSGWLTRFVEIPSACFQPVKTVLDLRNRL